MWLAFGSFYARRDILSGYAANIWWIVNYALRAWYQVPQLGWVGAFLAPVRRILAVSTFQERGFPNPRPLATSLVLLTSAWSLWRIRRSSDLAVHALGAAFIVHAFFVLSVGVHEHHMMLAVPLLALAAALRPSIRPLFWTVSLIVTLNMNLFYGIGLGLGWSVPRGLLLVDLSVVLSVANIAALVWHSRVLVREAADAVAQPSDDSSAARSHLATVRGGHISRLQELEQRAVGIVRRPNNVVRQDELVQVSAVERLRRRDLRIRKTSRLRIRVGVVRGVGDRPTASPESAAADLVRVGLARDAIREVRNAARVLRRGPPRETRHGQIERAPEEVHRTALANESRTETLEHAIALHERAPEPRDGGGIVRTMHFVAIEGNRFDHFVRAAVDVHVEVEPVQRVHHLSIERRDRLWCERDPGGPAVADGDDERVINEVEIDLEHPQPVRDR